MELTLLKNLIDKCPFRRNYGHCSVGAVLPDGIYLLSMKILNPLVIASAAAAM